MNMPLQERTIPAVLLGNLARGGADDFLTLLHTDRSAENFSYAELLKERIFLCGVIIHVGIEIVPGEFGEMIDVVERDLARVGIQCIAEIERFKRFSKWMNARIGLIRTFDPAVADVCECLRCTLQSRSLHVVQYSPYPAQFLTATGASWATVHHMGQR